MEKPPVGSGIPALVRFDAYATLDADDIGALLPLIGQTLKLRKGDVIQHEGDRPSSLHLVLEGWTASSMSLPNGERQMLKVHLPGDMVGLPSLPIRTAPDTVTALTTATVSQIKLDALGRLFASSPRLAALLFLISQEERLMLMDRLTTVGRQNTLGRLSGFLLQLHARMLRQNPAMGDIMAVPLTQYDFADLIGVTTVHINRTARELRSRNLLNWVGREIEILDHAGLRQLAGLPARVLAHNQSWLPLNI